MTQSKCSQLNSTPHRPGRPPKTTQDFQQEVDCLEPSQYTILETYQGCAVKIMFKHLSCGEIFKLSPNQFFKGKRCPSCTKKAKKQIIKPNPFQLTVNRLAEDEYRVLSDYYGERQPILMKHLICGYEWTLLPAHFKKGTRCPQCLSNYGKSNDNTLWRTALNEQLGHQYRIQSSPTHLKQNISIQHLKCQNYWSATPQQFLLGMRCPQCFPQRRYTRHLSPSDFETSFYQIAGDQYTLLTSFQSYRHPVRIRHEACGRDWTALPGNLLKGGSCPSCSRLPIHATEYFKYRVTQLTGNKYTVLSEYLGATQKISLRHESCGAQWRTTPSSFLQGHRCPFCHPHSKRTTSDFKQELFDIVGDEYQCLSPYINRVTKVLLQHNTCGHTWEVYPNNFLRGTRCPICSKRGRRPKA